MHTPEGMQRQKKQEERVARVLTDAGIAFKREHQVDFTCLLSPLTAAYARIDFVIDLHGHVVLLEIDEGQHKFGYGSAACDMKRMATVVESLAVGGNTLPVMFIRYNPHAYTVDGASRARLRRERETVIVRALQDEAHAMWQSRRPLSVQYMYYDSLEGQAEVTYADDYNAEVRACCLPAIV